MSSLSIAHIGSRPSYQRPLHRCITSLLTALAFSAPISLTANDVVTTTEKAVETHQTKTNTNTPIQAQERLPFVELGAVDSFPQESKHDFLLRASRYIHAFTKETNHEVCGSIMEHKNKKQWRVRMITNRSHVACIRVVFNEQDFNYIGETIHSHPMPDNLKHKHFTLTANAQDQRAASFSCGRRLKIIDNQFSDHDIHSGGGYLVTRGQLLYHSGEGNHENTVLIGYVDEKASLPMAQLGGYQGAIVEEEHIHAAQSAWSTQDYDNIPALSCRKK